MLVRYELTGDASRLNGAYHVAGIEYDYHDNSYVSGTGTLQMDGAGGFTVEVVRNADGTPEAPVTDAGTYDVWLDGSLVIDTSSGDQYMGGTTPDGRFGMMGGGTSDGSNPLLYVFVK